MCKGCGKTGEDLNLWIIDQAPRFDLVNFVFGDVDGFHCKTWFVRMFFSYLRLFVVIKFFWTMPSRKGRAIPFFHHLPNPSKRNYRGSLMCTQFVLNKLSPINPKGDHQHLPATGSLDQPLPLRKSTSGSSMDMQDTQLLVDDIPDFDLDMMCLGKNMGLVGGNSNILYLKLSSFRPQVFVPTPRVNPNFG